jgi:hypothetical protein
VLLVEEKRGQIDRSEELKLHDEEGEADVPDKFYLSQDFRSPLQTKGIPKKTPSTLTKGILPIPLLNLKTERFLKPHSTPHQHPHLRRYHHVLPTSAGTVRRLDTFASTVQNSDVSTAGLLAQDISLASARGIQQGIIHG